MTLIEKENDLIAFSHKVISFRMNVIKACKAKGIEVPTDKQFTDYIYAYGLNFEDFMADYTEHEGMFRCLITPFEEFNEKLSHIDFKEAPTNEEIKNFFDTYGNNVGLFCRQHAISQMKPLIRKTYLKTIEKLSSEHLVKLWNTFIDGSDFDGRRSLVYDLTNEEECDYLCKNMDESILMSIHTMILKNNTQFIQVICGEVIEKSSDDIVNMVTTCWSNIFEHIMLYPYCYDFDVEVYRDGYTSTYFSDVFFPVVAKKEKKLAISLMAAMER